MTRAKYRRRRMFVQPDMQLRVVLVALTTATTTLSITALWCLRDFYIATQDPGATVAVQWALASLKSSIFQKFVISIGISLPLSAAIGIFYSFRFAGPLYRMRKYFESWKSGRWDQPCTIRKNDDLQNLCAAINEGLGATRALAQESRELLKALHQAAERGDWEMRADPARLAEVQSRIAKICGEYALRFPEPAPSPGAPAQPTPQPQRVEPVPA